MPYFDTSNYFVSFQPYQYPSGTVPVTSVRDMISFSPEIPTSSVALKYNVGASGSYSVVHTIKNMTTNTTLLIRPISNRYFNAYTLTPISSSVPSTTFTLTPAQTGSILISLNKTNLTTDAGLQNFSGGIGIVVEHSGLVASLRDLNATPITASKFFTSSIEIS